MRRFLVITVLCSACGGGAHHTEHTHDMAHETQHQAMHHEQHGGHQHHFDDPAKYAASWNSPERAEWQKPDEVIGIMAIEPGQTVADLGAGTGYFVPYLSAAVGPEGKVYALDVEDAMIAWLGDMVTKENMINVEARKAPFDSTGLGSASLDRLVTVNTWHHIEQRAAYAKHLHDVIKPGGRVVVVDFTKDAEGPGPPPEMRLDPQVVIDELNAGGFEAEVVTETLPRQYIVVGHRR